MKSIVVFCGSSAGNKSNYAAQAKNLGRTLAQQDIELIYGGAQVGIMGAVADGCLEQGGKVTGVIPHFLSLKEIEHSGVTKMIKVENMHERKKLMHELSDGIIALPGGYGTLEELFEMLTWAQLNLHQKPIGILNIDGYYDALLSMIQTMVDNGFLSASYQNLIIVSEDINILLSKMNDHKPDESKVGISIDKV